MRQKEKERGSKKKETKKEAKIKIKKEQKDKKINKDFGTFVFHFTFSMRVIFTFAPGIKQDADFVVIFVSKH